ncbi:hypothetical protein WH96_15070 [Kiloniella spongiae]|uniref:Uncharacterized protein n=1 Tax=Kiloniella spongiae TaxID=1489064 RepID=A0A0H2MTL5_9PROT|nr:hypothetical protein [Kiloniella spongiae]KLN60020.1 hypothetical protein WH96_15070 [Kiloniella spongiae]
MTDNTEQKIRAILENTAQKHQTISYRMLAIEAEIPGPQIIHKLTHKLEDIMRTDHSIGALSLVPLAVSRGEPAIPRGGFFILLRELGLYTGSDQGTEAIQKHTNMLAEIYSSFPTS